MRQSTLHPGIYSTGNVMSKSDMTQQEKRLRRNNLLLAGLLAAIALTGILVPLFYYTGLVVPK
jgi:hypothetical protein